MNDSQAQATKHPFYSLIILILAGESVFILPFVLARIFRPTFLEVFDINNLQLGFCFSIYGIVALISYLFGGIVADLAKPRILISTALLLTAFGGFYMSTIPSLVGLKILFGYWGFTTIFLFWAAMIKATRIWGGKSSQGKAFGFLDGGRGIVAATLGLVGVYIFSIFMTGSPEEASFAERKEAFQYVIRFSSIAVVVVSLIVFIWLRSFDKIDSDVTKTSSLENIIEVLKIPSVWLLMLIIMCAYVGYKLTDIFSLYAREVMLYDEVRSAKVGVFLLYIRPIVGFSIGFLIDRTRASIWMIVGFSIMILGAILFISGNIAPNMYLYFLLSIFITVIGVYAIRTLYFAALQEGQIPLIYTGTAVGLMSLIGYTPDIFVGPIMGALLDNSPGEQGHVHVFIMLAIFSFVGLVCSIFFHRVTRKKLVDYSAID